MRAGSLTTRLVILRPATRRDGFSSLSVEWEEEPRRIRAEAVRVTARSIAENSQEWADYSPVYRVSIAHAAALKEGLRLRDERDPGKRVYSIRTIIADRPTASLTLNCDRVNP